MKNNELLFSLGQKPMVKENNWTRVKNGTQPNQQRSDLRAICNLQQLKIQNTTSKPRV